MLKSLITVLDLTWRKRAVDELRRMEARLEEAQRIAHFGWWERDFKTNRVLLSDALCRIFGVEPAEMPEWHQRWLKLIYPEDRPRVAEAAAAALRRGPRYDVEYRVVRPDGAVRIVHSRGNVTWDETGKPLRQFGILQDITELRLAEQELRASEARFRTFVDHATDAFFLLDDRLKVVDVNRQACDSLGYSREELVGMHPRDFDVGLGEASIERLRQRIAAGEILTFETRHRRKDEVSFPVEISAGQFEPGGRLLCLVRDITERKRRRTRSEEARSASARWFNSHSTYTGRQTLSIAMSAWSFPQILKTRRSAARSSVRRPGRCLISSPMRRFGVGTGKPSMLTSRSAISSSHDFGPMGNTSNAIRSSAAELKRLAVKSVTLPSPDCRCLITTETLSGIAGWHSASPSASGLNSPFAKVSSASGHCSRRPTMPYSWKTT